MTAHYFLALGSFVATLVVLKSLPLAIFSLLAGVFLDVDHLIDYWLANGFDLNYKKFIHETVGNEPGVYFRKSQKIVVLLHSWELLPLILVAAWVINLPQLAVAFAFGLLPHLLWDQKTYAKRPLMYSLVFRALHKFDLKEICATKRNFDT